MPVDRPGATFGTGSQRVLEHLARSTGRTPAFRELPIGHMPSGQSCDTGPVVVDLYVECSHEGVQVRCHR